MAFSLRLQATLLRCRACYRALRTAPHGEGSLASVLQKRMCSDSSTSVSPLLTAIDSPCPCQCITSALHMNDARACCYRKAAVSGEDMLDFLKGIVEGVPDLGPEEDAPPPDTKPKRRR